MRAMANPYDPNVSPYQGQPQAFGTPPVAAPAPSGLHFLEALGHFGVAALHVFRSKGDEDEEGEDEGSVRPRPRSRYASRFSKPASGRVGKGSCCRAPSKPK